MRIVMSAVNPPNASAPTRRERARATRLRIAKAAYALFCARGYAGTTMAEIADAAGVAVQTVYFAFHTKSELLRSAYELAVLGEDDPLPPEHQAWWGQMSAAPDVVGALRHVAGGVGAILIRVAPLDTVVRASSGSDPDIARVLAASERLRVDGYRRMLDVLSRKSALRDGLTPERATHLLLLYLGTDVYRVLVNDFGWTHAEWIEWAVVTVAEQVFAPPDAPRR